MPIRNSNPFTLTSTGLTELPEEDPPGRRSPWANVFDQLIATYPATEWVSAKTYSGNGAAGAVKNLFNMIDKGVIAGAACSEDGVIDYGAHLITVAHRRSGEGSNVYLAWTPHEP